MQILIRLDRYFLGINNLLSQSRNYLFICFFSFSKLDTSTTKSKTFDPVWNEVFIHEVRNAKNLGLTVFHDAAIPPDDFVANCTIPFEDMVHKEEDHQDFWVSWT